MQICIKKCSTFLQVRNKVILFGRELSPAGKVKLAWTGGEPAPEAISRRQGTAVVHRNTTYFSHKHNVYSYQVSEDKWTKLPVCKYEHFAMAVVNNLLTTIGGYNEGWLHDKRTRSLLSLAWKEVFPPMPTKRSRVAAANTPTHLIVAGGRDHSGEGLATVEVLNTETLQWSTASSLPHTVPVSHYVAGAHISPNTTKCCLALWKTCSSLASLPPARVTQCGLGWQTFPHSLPVLQQLEDMCWL